MSDRIYRVVDTWPKMRIVSGAVTKQTKMLLFVERGEASNYGATVPADAPRTAADAVAGYIAGQQARIADAESEIAEAKRNIDEARALPTTGDRP